MAPEARAGRANDGGVGMVALLLVWLILAVVLALPIAALLGGELEK